MEDIKEIRITADKKLLNLHLSDIWAYRDLVLLLVRRDFVSQYKQTILGPLWFFLQPLFTTVMFLVLFAKMGKLSTDGLPPALFYLCGITFWNYFSSCLKTNSTTFITNQNVFGKVYFPRIVLPLSVTISNIVKLGIQFLLFLLLYVYYVINGFDLNITWYVVLVPLNIFLLGFLGLGLGVLISSLTTKYRDLTHLVDFGLQLAMYATIIFPVSAYPDKFKWIVFVNPLIPLIETTKLGLLGVGDFNLAAYFSCLFFTFFAVIFGVLIFNKTEQNFMDVI